MWHDPFTYIVIRRVWAQHIDMWHDSPMCDITHWNVKYAIHIGCHGRVWAQQIDMWHDSIMCDIHHWNVTWAIHMSCHTTSMSATLSAWHSSLICDMTHPHCATRLIQMWYAAFEYDMIHSYLTWTINWNTSSTKMQTCLCDVRLLPTTTHCNTLQHSATLGNTLQHTATHRNTLQHSATLCNTLQHTATHQVHNRKHACATHPSKTATHSNTQQHTATHSNTQQHTAIQRNILQHKPTQCNTVGPPTVLLFTMWYQR